MTSDRHTQTNTVIGSSTVTVDGAVCVRETVDGVCVCVCVRKRERGRREERGREGGGD